MKHLKLFFALFAMLALGVGNAWGAEETITLSTFGWSNASVQSSISATTATITLQQNEASTAPTYYTSDGLRLYGIKSATTGGTISFTPKEGITISKIVFTHGASNSGVLAIKTGGGSYSSKTWSGTLTEGNTVSLVSTNSGTKNPQVKITNIVITYETASSGGETPDPITISLDKTTLNLQEGATETLTATVTGSTESVTWSSSATGVASVDNTGKVTAVAAGNATITAAIGEVKATCAVTVTAATTPEEPGTGGESTGTATLTFDNVSKRTTFTTSQQVWTENGVTLTNDKASSTSNVADYCNPARFYKNSKITITHTSNKITQIVFDCKSSSYATALQSAIGNSAAISDDKVTVNITPATESYVINALSGGQVQMDALTVTYETSGSGSTEPVVSLKLDQTSLKLNKGTTATLTATVENSEDPITWSSDKPSVATIANGVVTAVGKGTATITASVGEVKATCSVEVIEITGAGTEESPYTATDIITLGLNDKTAAWVEGYIIGVMEDNKFATSTTTTTSNIVLADAADEKENYVPVALPSGSIRTALNIVENSSNLGKKVAVYGTLETYFTRPGVKSVSEYKWIVEEGELAAPTFTPAGGTYYEVQNVTISAEEGTTVYYTLDGNNPTTSSNVYSSPIQIAETATLKAIAVKGEKTSPVASENYTINLPLTTMDQIFAKATAVGNTATSVQVVMNNWVITGVKGSNAYLTDGTKGLIIYTTSHGFEVGDVLSGTVECKVQLYNGSSELKELTSTTTGLTITKGGVVTPIELDADGIADLKGVNTGSVIKINGVATAKDVVAGVKLYNTLFSFADLTETQEYNVTGVYLQYNDTKEILPRSEADIEKVEGLPTVIIDIADITMEVGEEKAISVSTNPADAQVTYTIKSGTCVTLDGSTIKAVSEGTATITASVAEKAGEYKGATKDFTVTVKTPEQALTDWVLTSLSDITINDLVVITMTKGETIWAMTNNNELSAPTASVVTLSANALADQPAENLKWVVANESGNITIYPYGGYGSWLYCTNTNNGVKVGNNDSKIFTIDAESGYLKHEGTSRFIGVYNAQDWRCYTSINSNIEGQTLAFYVKKNANDVLPGTGEDPEGGEGGEDPVVPTPTINATATFVFNTAEGLNDLGITYPATDGGSGALMTEFEDGARYTQDGITMTTTNGDTKTRVWQKSGGDLDLRIYKNASLTLSVGKDLVISNVVFTGKGISNLKVDGVAVSNNSWAGSKQSVTFDVTATTNIYTIAITVSYTREVTSGNFGTICLPYGSTKYSGAKFYEIAYLEMKGTNPNRIYLDEVEGGVLEAGKPYIFQATSNKVTVAYEGEASSLKEGVKGLVGILEDSKVVNGQEGVSNILTGNYVISGTKFYTCGTGCSISKNRAYIDASIIANHTTPVAEMPGRRRIAMGAAGENQVTGVDNTLAPKDNVVKVIENGQLIIIRDGVKYNVQGQKL